MSQNMDQGNISLLNEWRAAGNTGDLPVGWNGSGGGGSGGSGFKPLSAPDVAKLRDQVFNTLKPYYTQLLTEVNGDFDRATAKLQEDYVKGVRDAKVNYAFVKKTQTDELMNTLASLGITNLKDQDTTIDDLNKRGMAVYQNDGDGTNNVVKDSAIDANLDNNTSKIRNPQNGNMGRGGFELARLQEEQRLRQEASQRAATKPIEQAGISLKQYTNLPAGVDPNQSPDKLAIALAAPGVDRSTLGTSEQDLIRNTEDARRAQQKSREALNDQQANDTSNISGQLASNQINSLDSNLTNEIQKEHQGAFVNTGN